MSLFVRPAVAQDDQFLHGLTFQVLHDQLYAWLWDPAVRQPLLDLQVRAKRSSFAVQHPDADNAVIMLDNEPVGAMLIDRSGESYHLVDISILPKHRGAGIGTRLILALCMEAEMTGKSVRLYVSTTNPRAEELYRRLGFHIVGDNQTDKLMERAAGARAQVIATP